MTISFIIEILNFQHSKESILFFFKLRIITSKYTKIVAMFCIMHAWYHEQNPTMQIFQFNADNT